MIEVPLDRESCAKKLDLLTKTAVVENTFGQIYWNKIEQSTRIITLL
jgi:hypothetical protein